MITRQNHRLTSLVSDLLLLSRLAIQTTTAQAPCCLQDVPSDIEEELAALTIANNIHLILDQPTEPSIMVTGNEEQLYRMVLNLVGNALHQTPPEGKVIIRLRQTTCNTFPEGEKRQAHITIEDTGTGIAPAEQLRIFDRFYRVDKDHSRQSGGSGLGLPIALAIAVELVTGERIKANRAIVANLTPDVLFQRLLRDAPLSPQVQRYVKSYVYGPATMMVHLALKGQPQWRGSTDMKDFAYVHIAPYVENLAQTYNDSINGILPADPLLIVGQTSAVDPTRTPGPDDHILWIQVRTLPSRIRGDARGEIQGQDWDEVKEPFTQRVIHKLDHYAPGIRDQILGMTVYSPKDLERHNPNLVGGDSIGGSFHPRQNFLFRPFPNYSNYRMPLAQLYMVGAGTWPGPGTNATSGYLCAQAILHSHSLTKTLVTGAAVGGAAIATGMAVKKLTAGHEE